MKRRLSNNYFLIQSFVNEFIELHVTQELS